jgi:hypothetical protein
MINVEEVVKKSLKEKLNSLEIEEINKSFLDQEKKIVLLFSEHFSNHISTETAKCVLENVDLLHPDIQFIVKYEIYKIISFYHFTGKKNLDIFSLLLNKKDFYNKIYYVIESKPATTIIFFINELCQKINKYSLHQEYYNCIMKLLATGSEKAIEIINLLDNETRYDLHVNSMNGPGSLLWSKFDSFLNPNFKHPKYYNYFLSKIEDDSEICLNLDKMSLNIISKSHLKKILINNQYRCSKTINNIIARCVKEKAPQILLQFAFSLSEKEILSRLFQIGDENYISSFIKDRKNEQSIKDLIAYY